MNMWKKMTSNEMNKWNQWWKLWPIWQVMKEGYNGREMSMVLFNEIFNEEKKANK